MKAAMDTSKEQGEEKGIEIGIHQSEKIKARKIAKVMNAEFFKLMSLHN